MITSEIVRSHNSPIRRPVAKRVFTIVRSLCTTILAASVLAAFKAFSAVEISACCWPRSSHLGASFWVATGRTPRIGSALIFPLSWYHLAYARMAASCRLMVADLAWRSCNQVRYRFSLLQKAQFVTGTGISTKVNFENNSHATECFQSIEGANTHLSNTKISGTA